MCCCTNCRSLIELNWFRYIIYWISKPVKNWCESFYFNLDKCFHFYPETGLYINLLIVLSLPALLSKKSRCILLFFILCFLILFNLLRQQQLFFNINTVVCISAPQKALMNTEWYFLFCCQGQSRVLQALGHRIGWISLWDEISQVILIFLLMHFIFQFNSLNVYFVRFLEAPISVYLHFINTSHLDWLH